MLQVDFETDPVKFIRRHGDWLRQHAAEHSVFLSICQAAERKALRQETQDIRFVTLSDDDGVVMTTVHVPPHNLVVSRSTQAQGQVDHLVDLMADKSPGFPAIVGPSDVASSFASRWTAVTGQGTSEYMDQIIYALTTVHFPPPVDGVFRLARPEEKEIVAGWMAAFAQDALPKAEHLSPTEALARAEERIAHGSIAVWDIGGRPVAQAGVSGTDQVARISLVYTPPENRGQGYASAVVARLSQQLLDQGREMCCLYADARNPVSNSIYRKIGYQFVGRSSLYVLDAAG